MPGAGDYLGLGQIFANLLALPNTMAQQNQSASMIRQALSSQPGVTPELLNAIAPGGGPQFPGYNTPVVGSLERGIGRVGQGLQMVLGNAPQAPRLPLGTYVALRNLSTTERKQKALEDIGRSFTNPQAAEMLQVNPTAAVRMEKGGDDTKTPFALWKKENPSGTYAQWKTESKKESGGDEASSAFKLWQRENPNGTYAQWQETQRQGAAPNAERDLDLLAKSKFPNDPVKQAEWKEGERIAQAGGKAAVVSERRTSGQQLAAITGAKAILGRGKEAIAKLLATSPPELLAQPMSLWLKRFEGNPAAVDARLAILGAPELAKSMGLTSRFNQTEFTLYSNALNPEKMSAQEYLTTMERLGSLLDDTEQRLRGPSAGGTSGGTPQPGANSSSEAWHSLLDSAGVPR